MTFPKTIVLAVTNYYGPFSDDGKKTGAYFSEVYHSWKIFTDAGFKVQLTSEDGTFGWDDNSVTAEYAISVSERAVLDDKSNEFNKFLEKIESVKELDSRDFSIAFAAGGHGTVYDFDGQTPGLYKLFGEVYERGGLIAAVCRAPVLLSYVKNADGSAVINGKNVTSFPDVGETLMGLDTVLDCLDKKRASEVLKHAGSTYHEPNPPFDPFIVEDGRIITGANPASASSAAVAITIAFNKL